MIDIIMPKLPLHQDPGRKAQVNKHKVKMYTVAMDDRPYKMNSNGRHPFNIITLEVLGD